MGSRPPYRLFRWLASVSTAPAVTLLSTILREGDLLDRLCHDLTSAPTVCLPLPRTQANPAPLLLSTLPCPEPILLHFLCPGFFGGTVFPHVVALQTPLSFLVHWQAQTAPSGGLVGAAWLDLPRWGYGKENQQVEDIGGRLPTFGPSRLQ